MPRRKYAQAICALALITSIALSPLPAHASTIDDLYSGLAQALSLAQQIVLTIAQKAGIPVAPQNPTADPSSGSSGLAVSSSGVPDAIRALVSGQADANTRSASRSVSSLATNGTLTNPTILGALTVPRFAFPATARPPGRLGEDQANGRMFPAASVIAAVMSMPAIRYLSALENPCWTRESKGTPELRIYSHPTLERA